MATTQTIQQIKNELQSIVINLQDLTESIGTIVEAIAETDGERSTRPKTKRAPVRKKVVVKNGVVETIKRVPSTKIVIDLLRKSSRGMDIAELMKATRYDKRKVYNITFRLKKEGKILRAERGVYRAV